MNNFSIRPIEKKDINKNFYHLLGQLTHMDAEKMDANLTYDFLDNLDENHQILVIENCMQLYVFIIICVETKLDVEI